MLPGVDEALEELRIAGEMNPEKAYIVGLLHDIGRRVGIVDIPTHVYEGYKYCMEKGWDNAADAQALEAACREVDKIKKTGENHKVRPSGFLAKGGLLRYN